MPPRKRAKASAASTPLGDTQPQTPQDSGAAQSHDAQLNESWADEQETQLFKSMIKWKPTGLHKHFRMISIHNDMRSHGYATEDAPHTRIPGIWKKLHQLYDLETLDTREIEFAFSDDPDPSDPEEAVTVPDFELPEDEFGEMMWQKRFHREASAAASSPAHMSIEDDKALYAPGIGLLKALPAKALPNSTRSQKAESVAEATPTPKNLKNTRASRTAAKAGKTPKAGGSTAKNRKTQSIVSESAGEDDEEGEDERESSAESEGESAPTTRRTNRAKPKPAPKRTRKR